MQFAKQLDQIELRFEELSQQLADPDITSDGDRYRKAAKQHSDLSEMVSLYREWKRAEGDIQQARSMLADSDPDLKEMAAEEIARLEPVKTRIEEELKVLLLPKDPHDEKNVVLVREAADFAQKAVRLNEHSGGALDDRFDADGRDPRVVIL